MTPSLMDVSEWDWEKGVGLRSLGKGVMVSGGGGGQLSCQPMAGQIDI